MIACGNPGAGDDGAGLAAVPETPAAPRDEPGVEVVEAGTPARLLDLLQDGTPVVVVDAVRSRGAYRPGEVVRVSDLREGVPIGLRSALSSHGLGVAETVGVAAAVGVLPRIAFVGVEAPRRRGRHATVASRVGRAACRVAAVARCAELRTPLIEAAAP